MTSSSPASQATHGYTSPCARSCTEHSTGDAGGAQPVQTGRIAVISVTSSAAAGPTVTVLLTGSIDST